MKKISTRFIVQLIIVVTIFTLAFLHKKLGIEKAAPIDAYCPFGAVESFFTLIFKGEFLKRIFTSSFILLGTFLVASFFFGRIFCGYFCPLGAIQEWLRLLGKKLGFKKDLELPETYDKYLKYLKYLILIVIIYFSFYLGDLVFRNYDPYNALMHFGNELDEKIIAYSLLFLIIISSLVSKSWWCKYLCPLGAFFGIFKKISFLKISRDQKTCNGCGICQKVCPANLKIKKRQNIKDLDCISCDKCVASCPKKSLDYRIFNKKVPLEVFSSLIVVFVLIPLIIAPQTSAWKTKPESNIINSKGEINSADIKGSNTLAYLIEITKIPLEVFVKELNLPKDIETSIKLKEIGFKYGLTNSEGAKLETKDFREVVDNYIAQKKSSVKETCPFEEEDCEFPGKCGNYIDKNKDGLCDRSH